MRKIVINTCFGGFGLSKRAEAKLLDWGFNFDQYRDAPRDHPLLVRVVEEMGDRANGPSADLKIVEIPDDVQWHIHEYAGSEHVAENHRTWG